MDKRLLPEEDLDPLFSFKSQGDLLRIIRDDPNLKLDAEQIKSINDMLDIPPNDAHAAAQVVGRADELRQLLKYILYDRKALMNELALTRRIIDLANGD